MSKTIKTPKPEDTTIHWLHKAVNADGTVANGTYNSAFVISSAPFMHKTRNNTSALATSNTRVVFRDKELT